MYIYGLARYKSHVSTVILVQGVLTIISARTKMLTTNRAINTYSEFHSLNRILSVNTSS